MPKIVKILTLLSCILVCHVPASYAKDRDKPSKEQRAADKLKRKREKQKQKDAEKAKKDAFKRYYSIQCKDVRKRLKKQQRQANKKNKRKWHD